MPRVIGIDPGTVSFDVCGIDNGQVFMDTTLPSPEFASNPQKLIDLIQSAQPVDLIAAPSGYGLPLVSIEQFGDRERFLFTLVDERERNRIPVLGGMGKMIPLMKSSGLPFLFIPGVIHLPTVPEYRKVNKIDMGTADKLCCLVLGIFDQARRYDLHFKDTSFILAEVGGAYTAVMAVSGGKVMDGLGGSVGGPGFYASGGMDGELAYLLGSFPKEVLFSGGVANIAGHPEFSPDEFIELAQFDKQAGIAWEALLEGVCKSVAAELVVVPAPREILLSGRLCRNAKLRQELEKRLQKYGSVRYIEGFAKVAKEAAQGAALIADGLVGGRYSELVDVMELKGASGTVLDYLYINNADALRQKYLG
ncbi:MAG TPA: DUF1464 family protein [Anaerolineaceae bacterium]|nr:DUF1464 family protein [Anaerolineaceae bacterium]